MRNGVRHAVGAVIGLAALPAVYYGYAIGSFQLQRRLGGWFALPEVTGRYTLMLVGVGVLVALLAGWQWLSPLAPLSSGAGLTAVGAWWGYDPEAVRRLIVIDPYPEAAGVYLFVGVALLLAALFPARWRARPRRPEKAARDKPQAAEKETPVPVPAEPAGSLFQPAHRQPPSPPARELDFPS